MAQFNIKLPDSVLRADRTESIRTFADRSDWTGLPTSASFHADIISVILQPPDTDTSIAEEGLLLLATQRMVLFLDSPFKSDAVDMHLWLGLIERIEGIIADSQESENDGLQLCKDKMRISTALMKKAIPLIQNDNLASEILCASSSEVGESANIQTINSSSERITLAGAVAEIAKAHSFSEQDVAIKPSMWTRIRCSLFGANR